MKMIKRPAKDEDKDFLYFLNETVYRSLVEKINGVWDDKFQREYFNRKWEKAGYQIIEKDRKKIGAIWIEYGPDQHTLKEIQILPEYQNHGIGTDLLKGEIVMAKKAKKPIRLRLVNHIGLNVKADNEAAISCYRSLGFETVASYGEYFVKKK